MLFKHFKGDPCRNSTGNSDFKRAPRGFRRIGSGCSRVAFLERATSLVFKIGDRYANENEVLNAEHLASLAQPAGIEIVIPNTFMVEGYDNSGYSSVIVQDFAANTRHTHCDAAYNFPGSWVTYRCTCRQSVCFAEVLPVIAEWSGLEDVHGYNVLMDRDSRFWLIDLAG